MNILILEDDAVKESKIRAVISSCQSDCTVLTHTSFDKYVSEINRNKYDLIIADLVVFSYEGSKEPQDMTSNIVNETRDHNCINFRTHVVALTSYDDKAEECFTSLNAKDITVITTNDSQNNWEITLRAKIQSCSPPLQFDFVIICALVKEADAFQLAGYHVEDIKTLDGLNCRKIVVDDLKGVIVTAPRAGLVTAAILATQAIYLFHPRLICMSGICAGVPKAAGIYDVVLPDFCHQNDSGKWTDEGFEQEVYSIPIDHQLRVALETTISDKNFVKRVKEGITLSQSEYPESAENFDFKVFLAPTSSGSAVVADSAKTKQIGGQQRKLSAFEMESFAIYESARLSPSKPFFFSAKAVVDDGASNKGDHFHRVACLISAKVLIQCLASPNLKRFISKEKNLRT